MHLFGLTLVRRQTFCQEAVAQWCRCRVAFTGSSARWTSRIWMLP